MRSAAQSVGVYRVQSGCIATQRCPRGKLLTYGSNDAAHADQGILLRTSRACIQENRTRAGEVGMVYAMLLAH